MSRCTVPCRWGIVCLLLVAGTAACRDRAQYVGPEALLFDAAQGVAPRLTQHVQGMVTCATCPPNLSSMLIEIWAPELPGDALAVVPFGVLGAYEITVQVPHNTLLEVRAQIFTAGGVRQASTQTKSTADEAVTEAALTVNVVVE